LVAAVGDHAVDRRRPAQDPAASYGYPAAVEMGLGFADITPAKAVIASHDGCRCRHFDQHVVIATTRLDQQHAGARVLAEPVGQHTTGRTSADDDEVIGFCVGHCVKIHPDIQDDSIIIDSLTSQIVISSDDRKV